MAGISNIVLTHLPVLPGAGPVANLVVTDPNGNAVIPEGPEGLLVTANDAGAVIALAVDSTSQPQSTVISARGVGAGTATVTFTATVAGNVQTSTATVVVSGTGPNFAIAWQSGTQTIN